MRGKEERERGGGKGTKGTNERGTMGGQAAAGGKGGQIPVQRSGYFAKLDNSTPLSFSPTSLMRQVVHNCGSSSPNMGLLGETLWFCKI